MRTTEEYQALITSAHQDKPKFCGTVRVAVDPLAGLQESLTQFIADFDIDTAVGVQLDTIGIWIGVSREVKVPIEGFFFSWDDVVATGWDGGIWKAEFENTNSLTVLPDDIYRQVLRGKIAANNWNGDRAGQYATLRAAFGVEGEVLILDNKDMTQTVVVQSGALNDIDQALLEQQYIPIKPAGVGQIFEEQVLRPMEWPVWHPGTGFGAELVARMEVVHQFTLHNESFLGAAWMDEEFTDTADIFFGVYRDNLAGGSTELVAVFAFPHDGGTPTLADPTTGSMPADEEVFLIGDFIWVQQVTSQQIGQGSYGFTIVGELGP